MLSMPMQMVEIIQSIIKEETELLFTLQVSKGARQSDLGSGEWEFESFIEFQWAGSRKEG